jgi:hypothetical protein
VDRVPNEHPAANRARWLAELAEALDEASVLVRELGSSADAADTAELYARIEAVRVQVEAMRVSRRSGGGADFGPEWSKDLPWRRSA